MKPFVLLQTRPEDTASDNEYEAFMKFGGLDPDQLRRYRIEGGDVPEFSLDNYSGILLGGGPYCVSDPPEKKSPQQKKSEAGLNKLLDRVIERDFPFLGACYVGVVVEHEGGLVSRKYPEVIGGYEISLSSEAKADKLLRDVAEKFVAFSGHKESCEVMPKHAKLLASSPTCPMQMLKIKNNIYVCQFHPELDAEGVALRVQIYKNYGYFPPEDADKLIAESLKHSVTEPTKILHNFVQIYSSYV